MEKHFYIGDGPQAESLIAEALARENVAREARKALIAEYETDGLILSVWNDGKVKGKRGSRTEKATAITRSSAQRKGSVLPKSSKPKN